MNQCKTMFKLGFALVLIVVACNCSTSPLDEEPERAMEESLTEFSDDLEETFDDAADDGFDEHEAEYFEEENDPIEGNSSSSANKSLRAISGDPGWLSRRCGGRRYYPSWKYICCAGFARLRKPYRRPACCGTRVYDARYRMCCNGVIRFKPRGRPRCCGNRSYNANSKICCGGVISFKFGSPACCGTRSFDTRWKKCCWGSRVKQFSC